VKRILYSAVTFVIVSLLIAAVWAIFFTCHCTSKADTIVNCLDQIDEAKAQWAMVHPNAKATHLTWKDLAPYCSDFWKRPVADEVYLINKIGEPPSAVVREKVDWIPAYSEVRLASIGSNRLVQIRNRVPLSPWTTP
jgi:hypothetical protein